MTEGERVVFARGMMADGLSLRMTAVALQMRSGDLDQALWRHIGTPDEDLIPTTRRLHKPDF